MDVFVEQIIRRKLGAKDFLIFFGIMLLGIIIILASMIIPIVQTFSLLILVGVCFGAYYLISSRYLEFEYSCTNGDLTIDKIINRRKRKRVISFDVHIVEEMGPYKPEEHQGKSYDKRLITAITDDGKDAWYMSFRHKDMGHTLLVFNPNDKVLDALKPFLPRQLTLKVFGRNK